MQNSQNDAFSSVFGKIDDIEDFVMKNWGFLSNFSEIREQLIEDVHEYNALLEQDLCDIEYYRDVGMGKDS